MNEINTLQTKEIKPLISVIVRTQNRPHLLREALQSIAQQTYPYVEAVVVNDGGEPVKHIVELFENEISGGFQLIEKTVREGRSAAANTGIESAKGEWIAFLDDDDTFEPNGLKQLAQYIKWDKDIIYGQVNVWQMSVSNQENKLLTVMKKYKPDSLWLCNQIAICAYICKKENALKVGAFDGDFDYLEDWDFYFRLSRNASIQYVPQLIANYRVFGSGFITGREQIKERNYKQKFFLKHSHIFTPDVLCSISINYVEMVNKEALLKYSHEDCKKHLTRANQEIQITKNIENQLNDIRSKYGLEQSAWPIRFSKTVERLLTYLAKHSSGVIDLNALGLTIPTQVFSAISSTVYPVISTFNNMKCSLPVTKGIVLRWELIWKEPVIGHSITLQVGTYSRINKCYLKLKLIPQSYQADDLESYVYGEYIKNNEMVAFHLNKPLLYGRYLCELSSPDTDNVDNLLAIWLTSNYQKCDKGVVPNYRYIPPERSRLEQSIKTFEYHPLISILIPTYNTNEKFLRECLYSVINQVYSNWELCIADDASDEIQVKQILEEYQQLFPNKIKLVFCEENRHISATTNAALEMAEGEFIALLDHDDLLTEDALFEIVKLLNQEGKEQIDVIYSDEDKLNDVMNLFDEPFFKPTWSPENLKAQMYISHLGVYRRSLIEEINGFRVGLEGSQDWDLALRATEKARKIYHIPKILYHWRKHLGSTAYSSEQKSYAKLAGLRAVNDALIRENKGGYAQLNKYNDFVLVTYPVLGEKPLVSIIIPTSDKPELLEPCLESLIKHNHYSNFEIVLVNNKSVQKQTFQIFQKYLDLLGKERFQIISDDGNFNFSRLVNNGVKASKGEIILLLNNDIEVISPDNWLEEMVGYAQHDDIACVGCKLLYKDNTIQHAGVTCGMVELASHGHAGFSMDEQGYYGRLTIVSNYSAVTAACLMIKRRLWEEQQGFDETLAVAYNDVDFCLKLLSKGYRNVMLPHVLLYHYESKSRGLDDTPEKQQRFIRETTIMKQRWQLIVDNDPYYNPNLTLQAKDFSISPDSPYYCETNQEILP